jgi:hypothetical protein
MKVLNKDRFPHIYTLKQLGGDRSPEGEKYWNEHENEVTMEFSEIMRNTVHRVAFFGDNKKIHNGYSNRR